MYVAITRAKDRLFLTSADERMMYGNVIYGKPSRFVEEIEDYIDRQESEKKATIKTQSSPGRTILTTGYKPMKYNSPSANSADIGTGDLVEHKLWGEGRVVSKNGDDITIVFNSKGLKKLKLSLAPIKKKV